MDNIESVAILSKCLNDLGVKIDMPGEVNDKYVAVISKKVLIMLNQWRRDRGDSMLTFNEIVNIVVTEYSLSFRDIVSVRQGTDISMAKHVIRYLSEKYTSLQNIKIAQLTGARVHGAVNHSMRVVRGLLEVDHTFTVKLNKIEGLLNECLQEGFKG